MGKSYKVGTRRSPLALKQVGEAAEALKAFYPDFFTQMVCIETYGDRDRRTPISETEGSDFFTREIDNALLKGEIDFAVHSAKDLPERLESELVIAAITESAENCDVLVSKNEKTLGSLPRGARIGTSSRNRKAALKTFRPDFEIVDIRGNIEERLALLDEKTRQLDAIVIAAAGLIRLGLEHKITQKIPSDILKPHPLQGCLALITRKDNKDLIELLSVLDHREVVVA